MRFVLASGSPRRVDLLKAAGFVLKVRPSKVEEFGAEDLPALELAEANAELKAQDIQKQLREETVVLGADTVVVLGESALGKPKTFAEGRAMLRQLSGKKTSGVHRSLHHEWDEKSYI